VTVWHIDYKMQSGLTLSTCTSVETIADLSADKTTTHVLVETWTVDYSIEYYRIGTHSWFFFAMCCIPNDNYQQPCNSKRS